MGRRTVIRLVSIVGGVAMVGTGALSTMPAIAQNTPVVLSEGHVDAFEVSKDGDELRLMLKDDTVVGETVFRDPADVILHAVPQSAWEVLANPAYSFLGAPGDVVYVLPDVQRPGLLWPGANTQRLDRDQFSGQIQLEITRVAGPGDFKLYLIDDFGTPTILVDSADEMVDDSWGVFVGSHAHYNWAFTEAGTYTLTARAKGTLVGGTEVWSAKVDYTFVAGELPDAGDPASQTIVATIDDADGALIISVDPDDRHVVLPPLELAADGQSRETSGDLRPVTVTDTRAGATGWSASGQVGEFVSSHGGFAAQFLGWTPRVWAQADGQGVDPGAAVPAGFPSGDGLSVSQALASAVAGQGRGTVRLGADLLLRVPTDTPAGDYRAVLTFTIM